MVYYFVFNSEEEKSTMIDNLRNIKIAIVQVLRYQHTRVIDFQVSSKYQNRKKISQLGFTQNKRDIFPSTHHDIILSIIFACNMLPLEFFFSHKLSNWRSK